MGNGKTELYRHYNAEGQLLYIGVSYCAVARLLGHKTTAHWFESITHVTIERFETRRAALHAEAIAIEREKPMFNVALADKPKTTVSVKKTLTLTELAKYINMPKRSLHAQLKDHRFPVEPLPRTRPRRWSVEAVDAWLAGQG